MTGYQGFYHDKKVVKAVEAWIALKENSLIILLPDGAEREWYYGMIGRKQTRHGILSLVYEGKAGEVIDVADEGILSEMKRRAPYIQLNEIKPWWKKANGLYVLLATKFAFLAIGVVIYFLLVPSIIDVAVHKISIESEKDLGNNIKEGFLVFAPVDSQLTVAVNKFLNQLKLPGSYPIHATVLKSEEKNAFALPGGDIMIYSGLFNIMKDYSELVALIGHEIGHIEKRHSLKLLCRQTTSGIVLMVALGNFSQVTTTIFNNAKLFHQLTFSREYEEEADLAGLALLEENKVEQAAMVKLFTHLKNSERNSMDIQFLSTHPLIEKRIANVMISIGEKKIHAEENSALADLWKEIKKNGKLKTFGNCPIPVDQYHYQRNSHVPERNWFLHGLQ